MKTSVKLVDNVCASLTLDILYHRHKVENALGAIRFFFQLEVVKVVVYLMEGLYATHEILVALTAHTDSKGSCVYHHLFCALGRTGESFDNPIHTLHQFGPFGNILLERLNILVFQGQFIDAEIQG